MNYYSYSSFKKVIDELREKIIGCRINNITVINSHDFLCTLSMIKEEKLLISLNHQHPFIALVDIKKTEPTITGTLNESLRNFLKRRVRIIVHGIILPKKLDIVNKIG